jgi:zinc protease
VQRVMLSLIAALLMLAPASSSLAESSTGDSAPGPQVEEFVLDNGLKVLVVNRPGVPVVSTYVWYRVGSMDETRGQTGMAHFLEHMMFKGSERYAVGEVDAVTTRNGGSNNAFTSMDYTAYFIDLPKARFVEALRIEADRMANLTLDHDEFIAEKQVVQAESDADADDPSRQLWQRITQRIYGPGHPYYHPVLGWPQDVEDITRRDMRLFYERYYQPNNAVLVLVGDITGDEAMEAVRPLFDSIPRGPEVVRPEFTPVDVNGPHEVEVRSESEVIEYGAQYSTVPFTHSDVDALRILGIVLGGGVTSRLYRELVEEQGLLTDVAAGHSASILGGGAWVWGQLADAENRPRIQPAVDAVIRKLAEEGPDAAEVERARTRLIANTVFGQENASSIAYQLGFNEVVAGDWRHFSGFVDRVRAVTVEDVQRVAANWLLPENRVTGWLVPELTPAVEGTQLEDAQPEPLDVTRRVLSNGVTVLMLERRDLPVITLEADVRATRTGEPVKQAGLAQFVGELLDAGTGELTRGGIAEVIESTGSRMSFSSGGGSLRMISEHAETGINLFAQCLTAPSFPDSEVELQRRRTLAGIEASRDDTDWFARHAALASVYGPDSPLGRPREGTPETVASFTRDDAIAWHREWFTPDNTTLAVVGNFETEEMLALLEGAFGAWETDTAAPEWPEIHPPAPERREGEQVFHFRGFDPARVDPQRRRVMVDHPEKDQVVVRVQSIGVTRNHPDYFALLVMDNIFGTSPGFTNRFSRRLRDEMGLAYSTFANISGSAGVYPGSFLGYIGTRPENVEKALKTVYELIEELREAPVSKDELRTAQDYLKGSFVFSVETTGQLASLLLTIERYDLGFDYLVKYANAVDAVTIEDIQRVAREWLVPERMVEVLAGPVTRITQAQDQEAQE